MYVPCENKSLVQSLMLICLAMTHACCSRSLYITIDSQHICVFVGLKKGVERTLNTVTEVIQKVKDAVMQVFGEHVVPYVSSLS